MEASAPHIPAHLPGLSRKDRRRLEAVLREPIRYVDHPAFHADDAHRQVWGDDGFALPDAPAVGGITSDATSRRRLPVLTAGEERSLFLRFNYCRVMAAALRQRFEATPSADVAREMLAWLDRASAFAGRIAEHNLGLAFFVSARFRTPWLDQEERLSAALLGLMMGIERYNPSKGARFSTYGVRAINSRLVVENMREERRRKHEWREGDANNGESPTAFSLATATFDSSTDAQRALAELIERQPNLLTRREKFVLGRRFGLNIRMGKVRRLKMHVESTLLTIDDSLNVSRERSRQTEPKAVDAAGLEY